MQFYGCGWSKLTEEEESTHNGRPPATHQLFFTQVSSPMHSAFCLFTVCCVPPATHQLLFKQVGGPVPCAFPCFPRGCWWGRPLFCPEQGLAREGPPPHPPTPPRLVFNKASKLACLIESLPPLAMPYPKRPTLSLRSPTKAYYPGAQEYMEGGSLHEMVMRAMTSQVRGAAAGASWLARTGLL